MADGRTRPPTTVHKLREALTAAEAQAQHWQEQYDYLLNNVRLYVHSYEEMKRCRRTLVKQIKENERR